MMRRSFAFAFADKVAVVGTAIISMAIVSRILAPAEVGLFLVASSVIILIEAFRDFGVGTYLVQEKELDTDTVRSAVTLIASLSVVLGLATLAGSEWVAKFYDNPALAKMIAIAALSFVVAPVSTPLLALLRRDMKFGQIAIINVVAGLGNAGVTISLALLGFGAVSLVWGSVCAATLSAMGALIARPDWWIFKPCIREISRVVPFGAWSSVVTLLGMLFDALPRLILGRILGFDAVGFFARAVSLGQLPDRLVLSAVQPVVLPILARQARNHAPLKEPFLLGLSYVSGTQWPALAMLALLADPVVRLLLGNQWLEVIPLVQIVAPALFCVFPIYLCYPTLVALGKVRDMAFAMMICLPPTAAIMFFASHYGLQAMALSLFITGTLQSTIQLVFVNRHMRFGMADLSMVVAKSLAVSAGTVALPLAGLSAYGSWHDLGLQQAMLVMVGGTVGWVLAVFLVRHPLGQELRVIHERAMGRRDLNLE